MKALDFPSNGNEPAATFVALQFINPQSNGLPLWGPSGQGTSFVWEYMPRRHTGYKTTFFWAQNDGNFNFLGYYGAHPYPPAGAVGQSHNWEIAIDGADEQIARDGSTHAVVYDRWYTQGLRVNRINANSKELSFYYNLPSTANADVIDEQVTTAGYGESDPAIDYALSFGDARWNIANERLGGMLGRVKVFSILLSEADIVSEGSDMSRTVTSAGAGNIWYGKRNWTGLSGTHLTCDYGTGRAPAWANANTAALADLGVYPDFSKLPVPKLAGLAAYRGGA